MLTDSTVTAALITAPIGVLYAFVMWKIRGGWSQPSKAEMRLMSLVADNPGQEDKYLAQIEALRQQEIAALEAIASTSWLARHRLIGRLESALETNNHVRNKLAGLGATTDEVADVDSEILSLRQRIARIKSL